MRLMMQCSRRARQPRYQKEYVTLVSFWTYLKSRLLARCKVRQRRYLRDGNNNCRVHRSKWLVHLHRMPRSSSNGVNSNASKRQHKQQQQSEAAYCGFEMLEQQQREAVWIQCLYPERCVPHALFPVIIIELRLYRNSEKALKARKQANRTHKQPKRTLQSKQMHCRLTDPAASKPLPKPFAYSVIALRDEALFFARL